jgi:hypothetical protein
MLCKSSLCVNKASLKLGLSNSDGCLPINDYGMSVPVVQPNTKTPIDTYLIRSCKKSDSVGCPLNGCERSTLNRLLRLKIICEDKMETGEQALKGYVSMCSLAPDSYRQSKLRNKLAHATNAKCKINGEMSKEPATRGPMVIEDQYTLDCIEVCSDNMSSTISKWHWKLWCCYLFQKSGKNSKNVTLSAEGRLSTQSIIKNDRRL